MRTFFVAHTPVERRVFATFDDARAWTHARVAELLAQHIAAARVAGFTFHRALQEHDHKGALTTGEVFLECRVRATAVGRPVFAGLRDGEERGDTHDDNDTDTACATAAMGQRDGGDACTRSEPGTVHRTSERISLL